MLTLQEIIKHLNMADFARLCFAVDCKFGIQTQFDVNYIELVDKKLVVQIDAGEGRVMKVTL